MDASRRHELLWGPSLYSLRPAIIVWFVVFAIALVTMLVVIVRAGAHASQATLNGVTASWAVAIGVGLLGVVLGVLGATRSSAERSAGYTTTPFAYPEVDLVDSRTGIVLGAAGEPLIDKRAFLDRRQHARQLGREVTR